MSDLADLNEKRIDRLENSVIEMKKELKVAIKEGFKECREIAPLTCPNSKKLSLSSAIMLCSVLCGVFLFLAKIGVLENISIKKQTKTSISSDRQEGANK